MCPLYAIKGRINYTRGMVLLNKVLQVQCNMKGCSRENILVKRTNGELRPLAVSTVVEQGRTVGLSGQHCRLQSVS